MRERDVWVEEIPEVDVPDEDAGAAVEALSPEEAEDRRRCRLVEEALFRRARGYVKRLKKSVKVKRVEYDAETGKKLCEREELVIGIEEQHVPADLRVCAYYLNNRAPERWREHPASGGGEVGGVVDFPAMDEPTVSPSDRPDGRNDGLDDPEGDGEA